MHLVRSTVARLLVLSLFSAIVVVPASPSHAAELPEDTITEIITSRNFWAANCQRAAIMAIDSGADDLSTIKLSDLAPGEAKKKVAKALGKIAAGAVLLAYCGPIIVPDGFSNLSYVGRRSALLDNGGIFTDPPSFDVLVDDPADPASCSATFELETSGNKVTRFGDFEGRDFAYMEPFGSYPDSVLLHPGLVEASAALLEEFADQMDVGIDVPSAADLLASVGAQAELELPLVRELIDKILGEAEYESDARAAFDGWDANVDNLPAQGPDGERLFPAGATTPVWFTTEIPPSLTGPTFIAYGQSVTVSEQFAPEWVDPSDTTIVYEALSPGGVDRSFTPPRRIEGSLEVTDNCDPDPSVSLEIPTFLSLGTHVFEAVATDSSGNQSVVKTVIIEVVDTISPDLKDLDPIGVTIPTTDSTIAASDVGLVAPDFFDFVAVSPTVDCYVTNSLGTNVDCATATMPIGESVVTWIASDGSGNQNAANQQVFVRHEGTNTTATTADSTVEIAAGASATFIVEYADADHDPIDVKLISPPTSGSVDIDLQIIWQTRFSLTGVDFTTESVTGWVDLTNGVEATLITPSGGEGINRYAADNSGQGHLTAILPTPSGFTPDIVALADAPHDPTTTNDLIMIDRDSGGIVGSHLLWWPAVAANPIDISTYVDRPVDISHTFRADAVVDLVVLDHPAAGGSQAVALTVDTGGVTASDSYTLSSTATYDGLDWYRRSGSYMQVAADWDSNSLVRFDLEQLVNGSGANTLVKTHGFTDPGMDLGSLTTVDAPTSVTTQYLTLDAATLDVVCVNAYLGSTTTNISFGDCQVPMTVAPDFADIRALAADQTNGEFLVIDEERLTRFATDGSPLASIETELANTANQYAADVAVAADGSVLVAGSGGSLLNISEVWRYDGELDYVTQQAVDAQYGLTGITLDSSGTVWGVGHEGLFKLPAIDTWPNTSDTGTQISTEDGLRDVAAADGYIYVTDLDDHVVHRWAEDGTYGGWIGGCSGTTDCANGATTGWTTGATPAGQGEGLGQFTFGTSGTWTDIQAAKDARIETDELGTIYVSDKTEGYARVQGFSPNGAWVEVAQPDVVLDDGLLAFVGMGDFTGVHDIAALEREFYLAEGDPLERVHVYDISAIEPVEFSHTMAEITYLAPSGPVSDSLTYSVRDPFTTPAAAATGLITIEVVNDYDPPTLTCPSDLTVHANRNDGLGQQSNPQINSFLREAESQSLRAGSEVLPAPPITHNAPLVFPIGTTSVTFTATDANSRTIDCAASVEVVDAKPTLITPADLTVEATGEFTVIADLGEAVGDDPSLGQTVTIINDLPAEGLEIGHHTLTWTATNSRGLATTGNQNVTVEDTTAPVLSDIPAPAPVVGVNGYANTVDYSLPTVVDADPDTIVFCAPESGPNFALGITEVSCFAVDGSGNQSTATFEVEIVAEDGDADGVADMVEVAGGGFSDDNLGGTTTGSVAGSLLSAAGEVPTITDALDEHRGVRILGAEDADHVAAFCDNAFSIAGIGAGDDLTVTCNGEDHEVVVTSGVVTLDITFPSGWRESATIPGPAGLDIEGDLVTGNEQNTGAVLFHGFMTRYVGAGETIGFPAAPPPADYDGWFSDDDANIHQANIDALAGAGITLGCAPGGYYCPDGLVTRAAMASVLSRALELPAAGGDHFTDDDDSVHQDAINSLAEAGITFGCATNEFCPDLPLTRAQAASLIERALDDLEPPSRDWFTDDLGSTHEPAINTLAENQITNGCAPSSYCPDGLLRRDQLASLIARSFGIAADN